MGVKAGGRMLPSLSWHLASPGVFAQAWPAHSRREMPGKQVPGLVRTVLSSREGPGV